MRQQIRLILQSASLAFIFFACGPSEPAEIPNYKPPEDRLKFSVPPYESPVGAVFTYEDKYARKVSLAGDFNNWNPLISPLQKNTHGIWQIVVPLKRGRYAYKFNVDGQWIADPKNFNKTTDSSGDLKSVMTVTNGIDWYFRPVAEGYTKAVPPTHKTGGIEFSYASLDASTVSVGGPFNQWNKTSHRMTRNRNGIWTITIPLEKGRHRYKICEDGQWREDPLNPATEPDDTGGLFSLVTVEIYFPDQALAPRPTDRIPFKFKFHSRDIPSRIPVSVIGDWNDWDDTRDILKDPDQDKTWEGIVYLRPGRFLYRFKIRTEEFPDPKNPRLETASDGRQASRLEVFLPPERTMMIFSFRPPSDDDANPVFLTGDFNNWDLENDPMEWDPARRIWFRVMDLPAGTYRYQYRTGGRIIIDPANPEMVMDINEVPYSIVTVPLR